MKPVQANLQETSDEDDFGDEEESMDEDDEVEEDLTEEEDDEDEDEEEEEDEYITADAMQTKAKSATSSLSLGGGNKKIVLTKGNASPKVNLKAPKQKVALHPMNGDVKNLPTTIKSDKQKALAKSNDTKVATATDESKPKRPSTQALVDAAIRGLNERSGSSVIAIKKYILGNFPELDEQRLLIYIKKYIKKELSSGKIVQTKGVGVSGSFKLSTKATKQEQKQKKQTKKKSEKQKEMKQKEKPKSKETSTKAAAATPNTNGTKEKSTKTATQEKKPEAKKPKTLATSKDVHKMLKDDQKVNNAKAAAMPNKLTKPKTMLEEDKKTKAKTTTKQQKQVTNKIVDTLVVAPLSKATKKATPKPAALTAGKKKADVIKNNEKPVMLTIPTGGRTEVAAVASAAKATGAKSKKK